MTSAAPTASQLSQLSQMQVYASSLIRKDRNLFFLGRQETNKYLGILFEPATPLRGIEGPSRTVSIEGKEFILLQAELTASHAARLRHLLPFLIPIPFGVGDSASVGCGDRLGLATPGHVRAVRGTGLKPILAQQSMRENQRTGRTPQQVIDEATWGVFQEGWQGGFGADADHLKTVSEIEQCAAAGYTFFTIDPGEYVHDQVHEATESELEQMISSFPWHILDSTPADLGQRLANKPFDLEHFSLTLNRLEVLRAAAKYGRAVAHTVIMYRHLVSVMDDRPFDLEMSIDETDTATTLADHLYIATELKRLGVQWVSLAPRYVGRFEKGVDYIGDVTVFRDSFAKHLAIAQAMGPYKLSLHSGSDKFSLYPYVAHPLIHLKTAGTSYLEALRAIAHLNPNLFREITTLALERYPTDRATYHVSAELAHIPNLSTLSDDHLSSLLDDFHARQIFHVTYGSVLAQPTLRESLLATLQTNEEIHYQFLQAHFDKHLTFFRS